MKRNKSIVALCPDSNIRERMERKLAIQTGFAKTEQDARKLIRTNATDYDLASSYFIIANNYSMRRSPETTQKLYRMALSGIAVIVGVSRIYPEHEFMCDIYSPDEIL